MNSPGRMVALMLALLVVALALVVLLPGQHAAAGKQAPSTAAKFGVMSVPTLLLFRGGAVKDQVVGLVSKQALADRVDKVL